MRFLSVCSGIEAASVAWNPLGWKAAAFSEIEPFPCAVLAHHYPDVPNRGDMTKFEEWPLEPIDLLCGGTPCQSFSVAGLRKGLDDPRGNLMLTFGAIAARYRPRWLVWENVPGVLSSNGGRDFGAFLGMLGQLGYGFAYRVLDAQFFGVPQRRRRVFVVGCLGDWRSAAAVLLERHSMQGHPAPQRQARQGVAGRPASSAFGGGNTAGAIDVATCLTHHGVRQDFDSETFIAFDPTQITSPHNRSNPQPGGPCHTLAKGMHAPAIAFPWQQGGSMAAKSTFPVDTDLCGTLVKNQTHAIAFSAKDHGADAMQDCSPTLRAGGHAGSRANAGVMPAIAFQSSQSGVREVEAHATLDANNGARRHNGVIQDMQVRRLTPRECERLQGFPDDYTLIPWRTWQEASRKGASYEGLLLERGMTLRGPSREECPDGPRYKALGNSWAVPNVRWIGRRIDQVQALLDRSEEIAA